MDKQLYILGAGRHPRTKLLRASRGHQRRTFYIGELHIQSGKRLPISVGWASLYFDTIVKHINEGTVLLHFGYDKFVDPEELRILCFGTPEEQAEYTREASAEETAEGAPSQDAPVTAAGPETQPEAQEVSQGPSAEELANVAERGTEAFVDLVDEPQDLAAEPETPLTEETEPEVVPEAPVAAEEPVDAPAPAEPEAVAQEPAAEERTDATPEMVPPAPEPEAVLVPEPDAAKATLELPEDWRKKSKSTLLGYAQDLGLDVSSMPSNKQLISMIESAIKGA